MKAIAEHGTVSPLTGSLPVAVDVDNVFYATLQNDTWGAVLRLEVECLFLTYQHYFNREIASTSWFLPLMISFVFMFGFSPWISRPISQPICQ